MKISKLFNTPKIPKSSSAGYAGFDNPRENIDPNIRGKSISLKQGTIDKTPTLSKEIANKAYVDSKFSSLTEVDTLQSVHDRGNSIDGYNQVIYIMDGSSVIYSYDYYNNGSFSVLESGLRAVYALAPFGGVAGSFNDNNGNSLLFADYTYAINSYGAVYLTDGSGCSLTFGSQALTLMYINVYCNGNADFASFSVNSTPGYTGDLNDSTSTKIADVVSGLITTVYY